MPTTRITTYAVSTGGAVTNAANAYDTDDSTTYATHSRGTNGTTTCDWSGFSGTNVSNATLYVYYETGGTLAESYWEYSTNSGSTWTMGGYASGSVSLGSVADLSAIRVRTHAYRLRYRDEELQIFVTDTSTSLLYGAKIDYTEGVTITGTSPTDWRAGEPVTITGTSLPNSTPYIDHPTYGTFSGSVVEYNGSTNVVVVFTAVRWGNNVGIRIGTSNAFYNGIDINPPLTSSVTSRARRGTSITLTGEGFYAVAVNHVYFTGGGLSQTSFTINSPTSITVTVPSGATSGYVYARNQWSEAGYGSVNVQVFYISSSTTSGKLTSSISISGDGFVNVSAVRINGTNCSHTVNSATSITVTVPEAGFPDGSNVQVLNDLGTETSPNTFTVTKPHTTSSTHSAANVGQYVTFYGSNFSSNGSLTIMWPGGYATTAYVVSDTEVYGYAPALSAGLTGSTYVRNAAGGTGGVSLTVNTVPSISSFTPSSARHNQTLTVSGSNFTSILDVRIGGVSHSYVVNSASQITINQPHASGYIVVYASGGNATSATQFTFLPPNITNITPNPANTGQSITITGTNLSGSLKTVFQGGSFTDDYSNTSDTTISTYVPNGAGSGMVYVQDYGGNSGTGFNLTILTGPTISGSYTGRCGQSVVITGTGFTGVTGVTVGGEPASYVVNSTTQITLTVPLVADPWTETVIVTTGSGSASASFIFLLPNLSTCSPSSGSSGVTLTVSGTNLATGIAGMHFQGSNGYTYAITTWTPLSDSSVSITLPATLPKGTGTVYAYVGEGSGGTGASYTVTGERGGGGKQAAVNCRI